MFPKRSLKECTCLPQTSLHWSSGQLSYTHFGGRDKFGCYVSNDDVAKDSPTYLEVDLNFLHSQTPHHLEPLSATHKA